ncbi:MAG: terminase small subunit [Gemmatimonadaceae bacterium]|nr:terminase small subunit [Gemmatimonadaceae bacterium]
MTESTTPADPSASAAPAPAVVEKPLTARQQRFVEVYLLTLCSSRAYKDAFQCSDAAANRNGPRLMANAGVAAAIARGKAERAVRTGITADLVLARLWTIAAADPRELIEYRRGCCRYCYGVAHGSQFTRAELAKQRAAFEAAQKKNSKEEFDEQGGIGFNATKPPHPDCPECFGEGVERAYVHDTRTLSAAAACLYAGVKATKDGVEVKMHDQRLALVDVGKHLGLFDMAPESSVPDEVRARRIRGALDAMDVATIGTPAPAAAAGAA